MFQNTNIDKWVYSGTKGIRAVAYYRGISIEYQMFKRIIYLSFDPFVGVLVVTVVGKLSNECNVKSDIESSLFT